MTRTNGFAMFRNVFSRSCFRLTFWEIVFCLLERGFFAAPGAVTKKLLNLEFGIFFSGRCSNKTMPEPQIAKARGVLTSEIGVLCSNTLCSGAVPGCCCQGAGAVYCC